MGEPEPYDFGNIVREMIQKSLFTERQIEILLQRRRGLGPSSGISRGAYYRQLAQSKSKMSRLYYTVAVLLAVGLLSPRDMDVMADLGKKMGVLAERDIFPEKEAEITNVIDLVIRQACEM